MFNSKSRVAHLLVIPVGLFGMASGPGVHAAPAESVRSDRIDEVVVTARRREESLQSVPISVTAITGEEILEKGVQGPYDLDQHFPALTIGLSGTQTKGLMFGVRAIRSNSYLLLDDPPVGTYYAESPVAHPWGFGETFFDLQSVQVLKGPQGTLFGRNTTAGAVLIEPNKPSFEEGFNGSIKAAAGNYDLEQLTAMVNIPFNDVIALRIAGEHKKRDGYTKNILSGQKRDGLGYDAIRVGLTVKPTDAVTTTTIVDYLDEDASPMSSQPVALYAPNGGFGLAGPTNPPTNAYNYLSRVLSEQQARGPYRVALLGGSNYVLPITDPLYAVTAQDQLSPLKCDPSSPFFVPNHHCRRGMQPKETLTNLGVLNNTAIEINGITAKNIMSYRRMEHRVDDDPSFPFGLTGDGRVNGQFIGIAPAGTQASISGGGHGDRSSEQSQITEEFQLQGIAFGDRLDWVSGAFYMREWGEEFAPSYINSAAWSNSAGRGTNKSYGIFAQGTYAVVDRLNLTLGYRWNKDKRFAVDSSTAVNGTVCQVVVSGVRLPADACELEGRATYSANTWTAALDYQLIDDTMVYATVSRGYKSGGFSLRTHNPDTWSYEPEYVDNYEIGLKSDWSFFSRPIRTNLAVYFMDFTDQQLQTTVPQTIPVQTKVDNIGKSEIVGYEFEFTLSATSNLQLSGFVSRSDPEYKKWTQFTGHPDFGTVDLTNRPYGNLSLTNAGLTIDYRLPLPANVGTVKLRSDASYHSAWKVDNSQAGLAGLPPGVQGAIPTVAGFTMVPRSSYSIVNLRADWQRPFDKPVDIAVFVTNATDKVYFNGGQAVSGVVNSAVAPPRMYGVELSYSFGAGFKPR